MAFYCINMNDQLTFPGSEQTSRCSESARWMTTRTNPVRLLRCSSAKSQMTSRSVHMGPRVTQRCCVMRPSPGFKCVLCLPHHIGLFCLLFFAFVLFNSFIPPFLLFFVLIFYLLILSSVVWCIAHGIILSCLLPVVPGPAGGRLG